MQIQHALKQKLRGEEANARVWRIRGFSPRGRCKSILEKSRLKNSTFFNKGLFKQSTKTHGSLDVDMIIYIGEDRKKEKEKKGISKEFGILFGKCFKKR